MIDVVMLQVREALTDLFADFQGSFIHRSSACPQ